MLGMVEYINNKYSSKHTMADEKTCEKCGHEHTKEDGTCTCGCEEGKK